MMKTAKLLLHCPDKPGILAEVTDFITVNKGNIIYLDQYVDHVENIFDDDRRLFLHAAPKASDYELHVPFIIWTSEGYGKQYPGILKTLSGHRTQQVQTSLSAFHTMLGIGGILTRYRQDKYSVASEKYHPVKLFYLNDHDEAIPQENAKY